MTTPGTFIVPLERNREMRISRVGSMLEFRIWIRSSNSPNDRRQFPFHETASGWSVPVECWATIVYAASKLAMDKAA